MLDIEKQDKKDFIEKTLTKKYFSGCDLPDRFFEGPCDGFRYNR